MCVCMYGNALTTEPVAFFAKVGKAFQRRLSQSFMNYELSGFLSLVKHSTLYFIYSLHI